MTCYQMKKKIRRLEIDNMALRSLIDKLETENKKLVKKNLSLKVDIESMKISIRTFFEGLLEPPLPF